MSAGDTPRSFGRKFESNMISTDVQDVRVGCRFDAVSRETFEGMSKMQRTEIEGVFMSGFWHSDIPQSLTITVRLATLVM